MSSENFPIDTGRDGQAVTATTAGTSTQVVTVTDPAQAVSTDVLIDNPGPFDVFVRAGGASTVATALSMRVPANSLQPFRKGQATHIAAFIASGSQRIVVHLGSGS